MKFQHCLISVIFIDSVQKSIGCREIMERSNVNDRVYLTLLVLCVERLPTFYPFDPDQQLLCVRHNRLWVRHRDMSRFQSRLRYPKDDQSAAEQYPAEGEFPVDVSRRNRPIMRLAFEFRSPARIHARKWRLTEAKGERARDELRKANPRGWGNPYSRRTHRKGETWRDIWIGHM